MSDNRISWTFDLQATCFRVTYKSSFLVKLVRKDLVREIIVKSTEQANGPQRP